MLISDPDLIKKLNQAVPAGVRIYERYSEGNQKRWKIYNQVTFTFFYLMHLWLIYDLYMTLYLKAFMTYNMN